MISFYRRALLPLPRLPCWNMHGEALTTRDVTSRLTRRVVLVVWRVVTWGNKWNFGYTHLEKSHIFNVTSGSRTFLQSYHSCQTSFAVANEDLWTDITSAIASAPLLFDLSIRVFSTSVSVASVPVTGQSIPPSRLYPRPYFNISYINIGLLNVHVR